MEESMSEGLREAPLFFESFNIQCSCKAFSCLQELSAFAKTGQDLSDESLQRYANCKDADQCVPMQSSWNLHSILLSLKTLYANSKSPNQTMQDDFGLYLSDIMRNVG